MSDPTCQDCEPVPTPTTTAAAAMPAGAASETAPTAGEAPPTDVSAATGNGTVPAAAAATFEPPKMLTPHIVLEFCDRCRWAPRATWIQTELLLTFPPPLVRTISLQPYNTPESGGIFRVWLDRGDGFELVWDRKTEGGFPELKVLKQKIRNLVQPDMSLGHSDAKPKA